MASLPIEIYRQREGSVRREFDGCAEEAGRYYRGYLRFVGRSTPSETQLLEVGSGSGWGAWLLARAGYHVTAMEVDARAFEVRGGRRLRLAVGSATRLPFATESFDVVTSYQVLEHVEQPARALREMMRVCRPGGVVVVCGPNLMGISNSVRKLARRGRKGNAADARRDPFGNTLGEALGVLARNCATAVRILCTGRPAFPMRQPDLRPPFRGDSDACYRLNPMDLTSWFRGHGWRLVRVRQVGRPPGTAMIAGGTWIAARKPVPW